MPGTAEDERNAANIYASLSSYVITAALGVIAAQATLAVFVLDKRDHLFWFYLWMICGVGATVLSIIFGGRGVASIASSGFGGTWTLKPKGDLFNLQALLCLLGIVCLLFSLFSGSTKPENPSSKNEIDLLNKSAQTLQDQINDLRAQINSLKDQPKAPTSLPCSCCCPAEQRKEKADSSKPKPFEK